MEYISTAISVLSALVAAFSALYARWQANTAKRANEIALHDSRLGVYNGLVRFRAHISARGTEIAEEEVWKLAEVAELAEFYFPSDIGARLNEVFESCLKLLSLNDEWKNTQTFDPAGARELVKPRHERMRQARDSCFLIADDIKKYLRVGKA